MPGVLLETKLHPPPARRARVERPRLAALLERSTAARLVLVSAPPGFGKTTLLAAWLQPRAGAGPGDARAGSGPRSAWLSLDEADADPAAFWPALLAAVERGIPGAGAGAAELLAGAPPEVALASLVNGLARLPDEVVLVLDDYHLVDGPAVGPGMAFLVDHLPANVHLVIATRADPALPLARLRARGELVEIRAADLRFTAEEASAYLREVAGLGLSADAVATLERRTEGWIAALQLAALSLHGRADADGFVARFAGDDRFVLDYLADEVLRRQPAPVRRFLLETSILGRLSAPLCDAVGEREDGAAMLERLERANLFLVALDDQRAWYRYHQLFADVLAVHLRGEQPDRVPELHRRASAWLEAHGERSEAIRHAIAAGDLERAAGLVELAIPELRRSRQEATLRRWAEALPDAIVRASPLLDVGYAGALMASGRFDGVEERLRESEARLEARAAEDRGASDELRRLPSAIAMYRAALARVAGDDAASIDQARRAVELAAPDDHLARGGAAGFLGLATWTRGDLAAAEDAWTQAATSLELAGHRSDVLGCSIAIADIQLARGRLGEALRTCRRSLVLGEGAAGPVRGVADMHVGLAELFLERNELAEGRAELARAVELGEGLGLPQYPYRVLVAQARFAEADGDLDRAVELLDEAERRYEGDFFPDVRPVPAVRARAWLRQGRLADAMAWARAAGVAPTDEPSGLREYELVTLARALLARARAGRAGDDLAAATTLLDRLLAAAEAGGRGRSVIELLVVRALAREGAAERGEAVADLERAVGLAEPEGFVRVFVDEGRPLARLLAVAARAVGPASAAAWLLATAAERARPPGRQPLLEPLSERELDVLRLLASDLDGPDIARSLFVSLNTLRTHTRSIYAKLGVTSRRAAVARAGELRLLSGRGD